MVCCIQEWRKTRDDDYFLNLDPRRRSMLRGASQTSTCLASLSSVKQRQSAAFAQSSPLLFPVASNDPCRSRQGTATLTPILTPAQGAQPKPRDRYPMAQLTRMKAMSSHASSLDKSHRLALSGDSTASISPSLPSSSPSPEPASSLEATLSGTEATPASALCALPPWRSR